MPDQLDFSRIDIHVHDDFDRMAYRFFISARDDSSGEKKRYWAQFNWVEAAPFNYERPIPSEFFLTLQHENEFSKNSLQSLFDDLWNIGIRPSGFVKNRTDQEKDDHIKDLRLFSFQLLNKVTGVENIPLLDKK